MTMSKCCNCGANLNKENQPIYRSGLFGADSRMKLCRFCGKKEEQAIEKEGTNYIPSLLSLYTKE